MLLLLAAPFDVAADAAPFEFGRWPAPHLLYNPSIILGAPPASLGLRGRSLGVLDLVRLASRVGGDGVCP